MRWKRKTADFKQKGRLRLVLWLVLFALGSPLQAAGFTDSVWETRGTVWSPEAGSWEVVGLLRVNLPGAKNEVELLQNAEGEFAYLIRRPTPHADRLLTPAEFHEALARDRPGLFWLWRFLNISGVGGLLWVALGLLGQVLFAGRMVVQWITSEREKRSVVPVVFWWMSLAGASMLLVYFLWRRDIIGVLGQGMGWMIYLRNLWLIYQSSSPTTPPAAGGSL